MVSTSVFWQTVSSTSWGNVSPGFFTLDCAVSIALSEVMKPNNALQMFELP